MAYYSAGRGVPSLARDCVQHPVPVHDVGMRLPAAVVDENSRWEGLAPSTQVVCFHGVPASSVEVKKEGAFLGQHLYLCPVTEDEKCKLFLVESDLQNPMCKCGVYTRENTVKKQGDNQGRKFLACGARKCKFFKWTS
jgi:hypothetical protein